MKNSIQNKTQITYFLMANENIGFDHVYNVTVYR